MQRRLVLIELNEINFDIVQQYLDAGSDRFPALRRLMAGSRIRTTSEKKYELLEPWIQWPSVHTGKTFDEHGLFRLGDVVESRIPQFFDQLEDRGFTVGAISPMNAANRLRNPAYFIPDPWTATPSDASWWSRKVGAAVSQAVNDNSQARIHPLNVLYLLCGLIRFARPRNFLVFLRLALGSRKSPWRKALFLDLFLHDLHMRCMAVRRPDFSVLFLNGGAHIQHHYFLNSEPLRTPAGAPNPDWYVPAGADPVAEMLAVYDRIVGDCMALPGVEKIIATGLSQRPYDRVKFYYRLRDHAGFLAAIGISFRSATPRMTRDFLVEFADAQAAASAEHLLRAIVVKSGDTATPLFGEVDNRGASLFVTLTYPDEIAADTEIEAGGRRIRLAPHVVFVAIKNGMHQEDGFAFFSEGVAQFAPQDGAHVSALYRTVMDYFAGDQAAVPDLVQARSGVR